MLECLSPEDAIIIETYCHPLRQIIKRCPILSHTDLVVEGGVGTGITMFQIARSLFPNAMHIGMDLSDELVGHHERQRRRINDLNLARVTTTQETQGIIDHVLYADCFDEDLVRDIAEKTQKKIPILVSLNSLFALVGRNINFLERKEGEDIHPITTMVGNKDYVAQLHLSRNDIWESELTLPTQCYYDFERIAQQSGMDTLRIQNEMVDGLLIVHQT